MFRGFWQARFAYEGSILSSNQFLLLPQLPQNLIISTIIVKNNTKIAISLHYLNLNSWNRLYYDSAPRYTIQQYWMHIMLKQWQFVNRNDDPKVTVTWEGPLRSITDIMTCIPAAQDYLLNLFCFLHLKDCFKNEHNCKIFIWLGLLKF